MGSRVLDRLVRPVVGGVHAADPDDLAVDAVAPGLPGALDGQRGSLARAVRSLRASAPAGSAVQGIAGGVHILVDALVADIEAHGGMLRTGATVRSLDDEHADRWVLATPSAVDLLGLTVGRPDPGAQVTLVTLVLDAPALDAAPRGTGVLVAREATDVTAKALTHATAKWAWLAQAAGPGRHVVRLSYGRAGESTRTGSPTSAPPCETRRSCWARPCPRSSSRGTRSCGGRRRCPVRAPSTPAWSPTSGQRSHPSRGSPCAARGWPGTAWRRWCPTRGRPRGRCSEENSPSFSDNASPSGGRMSWVTFSCDIF